MDASSLRIVARQTSRGGAASEVYQVVDGDGHEYCRDHWGRIRPTRSFRKAATLYAGLTAQDYRSIQGYHALEIDGVEQTPL